MPFTHVEIEERKTRNLALLFVFLMLVYSGSLLALVWAAKWLAMWERPWGASEMSLALSWREVMTAVTLSCIAGAIHWLTSVRHLLDRTLTAIGARPLDANDPYHAKFAHLVSEVSVATGGRSITPYVIATPAVNACAVSNFEGGAAIAVTEGALAMLNRAQLESVVGHEAAHIVSGDSLTSSVFCALFALHEEALKGMAGVFDAEREGVAIEGRVGAAVVVIYLVLAITRGVKTLCTMLISREKEYRADAVAVRLTRNPLSLAEALHIISRRWRGVGTRGESLSSLFIVDPGIERLSEQEGLLAELFSTHPPIEDRIALLLSMAHVDPDHFEKEMATALTRLHRRSLPQPVPLPAPTSPPTPPARWKLWNGTQWAGPFGVEEITQRTDFLPESWVQRVEEPSAKPAHYDPELLAVLRKRYGASSGVGSDHVCPRCQMSLSSILYEGATIEQCPACQGCYVDTPNVTKIFARQEYDIPEAVKRRGDLLLTDEGFATARKQLRTNLQINRFAKQWSCGRCGAAVIRKFFTEAYPVEVDQCWSCGFVWLDHQELELLQYMYEKHRDLRDAFNEAGSADVPPAA